MQNSERNIYWYLPTSLRNLVECMPVDVADALSNNLTEQYKSTTVPNT